MINIAKRIEENNGLNLFIYNNFESLQFVLTYMKTNIDKEICDCQFGFDYIASLEAVKNVSNKLFIINVDDMLMSTQDEKVFLDRLLSLLIEIVLFILKE